MPQPVFVIGVAGGTASGKTTVCDKIMQLLQEKGDVAILSQDSFYKSLTPEQSKNVHEYNFDHPDAIAFEECRAAIEALARREVAHIPVYDFCTHSRSSETVPLYPADVLIVEGILVLAVEKLREVFNMKVFVDTDDDVRLARRIVRDTAERGRDVAGVINQYTKFVKPSFDTFVGPSKKYADVIIPWSRGENHVAIDLIHQHIRAKVAVGDLRAVYPRLQIIPCNFQVRAMQTIIRDRNVKGHDFMFFVDRLVRLVVEFGLGLLPYENKVVETPLGGDYDGVGFGQPICGVSIIRSGETMESALRACCMGVKIGKILCDRDAGEQKSGKKKVLYKHLPPDIKHRYVLLMDPVVASGETAVAAIQVLLDAGVPEDRIIFLSLICSEKGLHQVCGGFPKLKVVTSEIDAAIGENNGVLPGLGAFGDRYFGTEKD